MIKIIIIKGGGAVDSSCEVAIVTSSLLDKLYMVLKGHISVFKPLKSALLSVIEDQCCDKQIPNKDKL